MIENINTPAIAVAAGVFTRSHCAGRGGPIACSLTALKKDESSRMKAAIFYHGGRLVSYTSLGAIFGAVGDQILIEFFNSPAVILPWFLVFIFVAIAFGLEKKIPRPAFFNRFTARLRFKAMRVSATRGSLLMGLATPLLPCTPLYLFFAACFATGSAIQGAEFALAFGLGTVPLLWATQLGFHKLQMKLSTRWMARCRKGLALAAALMMAWRLHDTIPLIPSATAGPDTNPTAEQIESSESKEPKSELPSCCH